MPVLRQVVGDTLRGLRMRQRRTLREVSAIGRVSLGYLSEVERGQKEPSSELLAAICSALDVELSDLFAEVSQVLRREEKLALAGPVSPPAARVRRRAARRRAGRAAPAARRSARCPPSPPDLSRRASRSVRRRPRHSSHMRHCSATRRRASPASRRVDAGLGARRSVRCAGPAAVAVVRSRRRHMSSPLSTRCSAPRRRRAGCRNVASAAPVRVTGTRTRAGNAMSRTRAGPAVRRRPRRRDQRHQYHHGAGGRRRRGRQGHALQPLPHPRRRAAALCSTEVSGSSTPRPTSRWPTPWSTRRSRSPAPGARVAWPRRAGRAGRASPASTTKPPAWQLARDRGRRHAGRGRARRHRHACCAGWRRSC